MLSLSFFLRIYAFIFISLFLPNPHTPFSPYPSLSQSFYPTFTPLSLRPPPLALCLSLDKDSIFFSPLFLTFSISKLKKNNLNDVIFVYNQPNLTISRNQTRLPYQIKYSGYHLECYNFVHSR